MRYVILLAVLAAASCAPLEDLASRVKRAKEIVMYGDQPSEAKDKVKRSEDEAADDTDKNGSIVSLEPKEIGVEEDAISDEEAIEKLEENEESSDESTDSTDADTLAPEEDAQSSEESELFGQPDDSADASDSEMNGDDTVADLQRYYDEVPPYYYGLLNSEQQAPTNYGYYDILPFLRKRRSQERIFLGGKNRARILKRSRRIKRDLIYPSESLGRDYLYGDEYPGNSDSYNELVGYLLDLLDEKYNVEPEYTAPYGAYEEPYDIEPYEELEDPIEELVYPGYEDRALESAVAKRQAGLTFVPGFKRNFYPYFEEPSSHFKAFVPSKRSQEDYADAYRRVMGLASALGQSDYYPGAYRYPEYDFRRK